MPLRCAVKGYSAGVGVLLLSSATVSSPRRFPFRRSSLLAWRSFFISRRSLRERSVGATDEFGVWDVDEFGEGDADGSTVGRGRSARGIDVALGLGDADSIAAAVELGLSLERGLSTGDRSKVGLAATDGAVLAVALGDADGDDVDLSIARGINVGRGVAVAVSTGVAVARAVADGVAVAVVSGVARRTGVDVAAMVAELAGVEVEVTLADGTAVAAVAGEDVEDADVVDVSAAASLGFTNVFGGAFGGGVASAFIFTRTFSVACRSPVFSQPRSTTTLAMVSLTLRGRSTAWLRAIKGAGTTMAWPRTTGRGSPKLMLILTSRSSRRRSIGCCVCVRISS